MASDGDSSSEQLFVNIDDSSCDVECSQDMFENEKNNRLVEPGKHGSQDMFVNDTNSGAVKKEPKLNFQSIPYPPRVAVPEKIVLCIDTSLDKGCGYTFSPDATSEPNPTSIRNAALKVFITNKIALEKETQFAVISVVGDTFKLVLHFTSNVQLILDSLLKLTNVDFECSDNDFDLTKIFNCVLTMVNIPSIEKVTVMPPDYVIRTIFVYCNSFVTPKVNRSDPHYFKYMSSPYCSLDILFLHEKESDFNNVNNNYKALETIISPRSYLLECSRDVAKLFNSMAKLLAHPCQRISQREWKF